MQEIDKHYKKDTQVAVIGIQTAFEGFWSNNFDALKDIAKEYDLTIPLGHNGWPGNPSPLMRRYRTRGTPWVVIIDGAGIVRANYFHFEPEQSISLMEKLKREISPP